MEEKGTVLVLMGGQSSEHDVSLNSGKKAAAALEEEGYHVIPVLIGRDGRWLLPDGTGLSAARAAGTIKDLGVDCVFIALHGTFGEDGRIQGFLDIVGVPYTGTGCAASALAMDKVRCKAVVQAQGIRVAGHLALDRATWAADSGAVTDAVAKDIGLPCVVKAARGGSSVGVVIVQNIDDLEPAILEVLEEDDYLMIEEFIAGREVTCGVIDAEPSGLIRPLPITEIRPRNAAFFDYDAKYTPGATEEITPADLPDEVAQTVEEMAVYVHDIVGCRGWSRSDFMIGDGGPVWIEVNTVPGLTETSLYPQAAAAAGNSLRRNVQTVCRGGNKGRGESTERLEGYGHTLHKDARARQRLPVHRIGQALDHRSCCAFPGDEPSPPRRRFGRDHPDHEGRRTSLSHAHLQRGWQ